MSITDDGKPFRLSDHKPEGQHKSRPEHRVKMVGVDHPVLQSSSPGNGGRGHSSTTFQTKTATHPHILDESRMHCSGVPTMITLNIEPSEAPLPDMSTVPIYETSIQYFNRTNRSFKITDRHNVTITLSRPKLWNTTASDCLVVRKIHRFNHSDTALSVLYNYQNERGNLSINDGELTQIVDRIEDHNKTVGFRNPNSVFEITIDRIVPINMLRDYASLYMHDLDLLISEESTQLDTPHPTSQDALFRGSILAMTGARKMSGVLFDVIDNENAYNPRYISVGHQVLQVPTNRDPEWPSGIYYVRIENSSPQNLRANVERCSLDEGEKLGIFPTREAAQLGGNTDKAFEIRLQDAKRQHRETEIELERVKDELSRRSMDRTETVSAANHERDMRKLRLEIERLESEKERLATESHSLRMKHELEVSTLEEKHRSSVRELNNKCLKAEHELEIERHKNELRRQSMNEEASHDRRKQAREDYYDERSHARKDTSELLKWAPTIVTGIVGVGAVIAIQSTRNQKSSFSEEGYSESHTEALTRCL